MAVQDRNIHRDARALRKSVAFPIPDVAAGDVDADVPFAVLKPRYNFRVMDLEFFAAALATAAATLKAAIVEDLDVVGTPQLGQDTAVTFTIEEFWQNDGGVLTNVTPTAAQAFTGTEVVSDGFWGVWLVQADGAQTITTKAYGDTMAFSTEALALANCPLPDSGNGVVAILTLEASGGDFTAGTTNTDAAAVNAFNTYTRDGHTASVAIGTNQYGKATLGQVLKDPAGAKILDGKGDTDLLVLTVRSAGAANFTNATAVVEYRPFPAQGEGRGNMSASQTEASFVP